MAYSLRLRACSLTGAITRSPLPYTPSEPQESDSLLSREECGRRAWAARYDGQELADQRTLPCRASGGSTEDCPGRQENGIGGSRESGPPEDRYKANPPFLLRGRDVRKEGRGECATTSESIGRIRRMRSGSGMSAGRRSPRARCRTRRRG